MVEEIGDGHPIGENCHSKARFSCVHGSSANCFIHVRVCNGSQKLDFRKGGETEQ